MDVEKKRNFNEKYRNLNEKYRNFNDKNWNVNDEYRNLNVCTHDRTNERKNERTKERTFVGGFICVWCVAVSNFVAATHKNWQSKNRIKAFAVGVRVKGQFSHAD